VSASPTETVERDLIRELRSRTRTSQVLPTASRSFCTTTARRWARASRSAGPSRLTPLTKAAPRSTQPRARSPSRPATLAAAGRSLQVSRWPSSVSPSPALARRPDHSRSRRLSTPTRTAATTASASRSTRPA